MNKCILSGYIGKKGIELKYAGEKAVATYSLAISTRNKGEYVYANCVTWGKQAEFLKNNEDRIKSILVEARLQTRSYEGKNGKVYVTEFVTEEIEVKEWKGDKQQEQSGFFPIDDDSDTPF